MTETDLYNKHVKQFLKKKGFYFFRLDYGTLPDIYAAKDGRSIWVELKVDNHPNKKGLIEPDWRVGQLSRMKELKELGGSIIVLCLWYKGEVYYLDPLKSYYDNDLKFYNKEGVFNG